MSRTKDYFTPVEEPDHMPQEQTQAQDQSQQVFAHMVRELIQNSQPELDF
jgi:hypothetical protein